MTTDVVVAEPTKALTPAQQRTDAIRKALIERLPAILPNGMDPRRFEAVTLQALAKNPDLMDADPTSIIMAVLEAAQLGLEPTGSLSRAWLVTYQGKNDPKPKAQLMIGYQGLVDLARRSGEVAKVVSRVVYEGDDFAVVYGTNEGIHHIPLLETSDPTKITHVYAIATLRSGETVFEPMTKAQVDGIRARSRSANRGPWVSDYAEMARKTVTRKLVKSLPLTAEVMDAIVRDDDREFNTPGEVRMVESRTSAVKAQLQARLLPASEPPSAADEPEVAPDPMPEASATEQTVTDGQGREICGAGSDPDLGEVEYCVLEPGHKLAHTSEAGSKFPQVK